jgi:ABC-type bacteriocin/lantibiotic exporter with double-glycine peptidase domain
MLKSLLDLAQFFTKKRKLQFLFLFLIMLLASIAELVSIAAIFPFLAAISNPNKIIKTEYFEFFFKITHINKNHEILLFITILFIIIILVSGILRIFLLWYQTRLSYSIGSDLSYEIYKRTLYQPYAVHISRNSSEIISGISNKAVSIISITLMPVLTILSSLLFVIIITSFLIFLNPFIALTSIFGFGLIYFFIIQLTKKKLQSEGMRISKESNQVIKALQEGLGGIRDVLIDGTQEIYCSVYKSADLPLRNAQATVSIIGNIPRFIVEALGMVLIALIAYFVSTNNNEISVIPMLGSLALGAQRLLPILQQAYSSWATMKGGHATLMDTIDLLKQPLSNNSNFLEIKPLSFNSKIILKNIKFKYTNDGPIILKGIDLEIIKGMKVGFIGETGSGKSTILDIIMGLLEPTEGYMQIDNQIINLETQNSWQKHIAHVPQSIFLSDATISENIAFGVPSSLIDINRVKIAADQAQISEAIEIWKLGFNTRVGERGVRLSGGQRQRIGIARALYKNSDVIVFDEATSSLDTNTENNVINAIEKLSKDLTIIIVAHRLSTLKGCDIIFEVKDGQIIRSGNYNQIINNKN